MKFKQTLEKNKIEIILFSLIFTFVLIKLLHAHPISSDENIYYLMAKYVSQGVLPYVNFNFAHPPLQVFSIALLFRTFGINFVVAKLSTFIPSFVSAILIFLISKNLFNKKIAIIATIFFALAPQFLAASDQGIGMWEVVALILLSAYATLKNKIKFSALAFSLAIFFRYLAIFYFPFLILLAILKKKNAKQFFLFTILFSGIIFTVSYAIFGYEFINQTILFQIFSKLAYTVNFGYTYLPMVLFTIFLEAVSLLYAYIYKNKTLLLFSAYPLIYDLSLILAFKNIVYFYFLPSLPFVMIAAATTFSMTFKSKQKLFALIIPAIILVSIFQNIPTYEVYLNPASSTSFSQIEQIVLNNTSPQDKIFGESSMTDYVSFVTGRAIAGNYLDSFDAYLQYQNPQIVVQNLEKNKSKIIIDQGNFYQLQPIIGTFIQQNYKLLTTVYGIQIYNVLIEK